MVAKINNKNTKFSFFSLFIWLLAAGILVYTRIVSLGWGLPYPMHPDERNMAVAIEQLTCKLPIIEFNFPRSLTENWEPVTSWLKVKEPFDIFNCFNPNFFAYGQFPLYLGYVLAFFVKFFNANLRAPVNLQEAIISLRLISALASVLSVFLISKIIDSILKTEDRKLNSAFYFLVASFLPFGIQFSHFGTTESLLMLFYLTIVYLTLLFMDNQQNVLFYVFNASFVIGLSLATKVSSLVFLIIPLLILFFRRNKEFPGVYFFVTKLFDVFILVLISLLVFVLFSPHNLLNWQEFLGSMRYESDVALGKVIVFYTRQFVDSVPVLFQMEKVFPHALGLPIFLTSLIGFMILDWRDKKINLIRLAFLAYFLPNAFMFAKWTRFMAPVFPIFTIFSLLLIYKIKEQIFKLHLKKQKILYLMLSFLFLVFNFVILIPGIKYLTVYQKPDIRFQATEWINANIPTDSYVLSETANVVDIPLVNKNNLDVISFNFYDLDENPVLQEELKVHLSRADYIFVPSRRIFANLNGSYPELKEYYDSLLSGELGFVKVAEFSNGLGDEKAEETWTVFDHPVIRIYKRVKSS